MFLRACAKRQVYFSRSKLRKEIFAYCRDQPHCTCYIQQIGTAQIEFEVEIGNYYHFVELIEAFKEQFAEHLGRIEYMLIKQDHFHRVPQTSLVSRKNRKGVRPLLN